MTLDPDALKDRRCPLCDAQGTLRALRMGRRMRVGLLSYALSLGKSFECTRCGARFSTEELVRQRHPG